MKVKQKQSQNVKVIVNLAEKRKPRKKRGKYRRMREPKADTSQLASQQFNRVQVIRYEYPVSGQPLAPPPPIQVVREPHAVPAMAAQNQNAFGTRDPGAPRPDRSASIARIPEIPVRNFLSSQPESNDPLIQKAQTIVDRIRARRNVEIPEAPLLLSSAQQTPSSFSSISNPRTPSSPFMMTPPRMIREQSSSILSLFRTEPSSGSAFSQVSTRLPPPPLFGRQQSATAIETPIRETREQAIERAHVAYANMRGPSLFESAMKGGMKRS